MAPGNDAKNSGAESMLVRDGRIAAIGPAAAVRAAAEPGAAVVRLDGATVLPGLIDAHCHVINIGYLAAGADCSQPAPPGSRSPDPPTPRSSRPTRAPGSATPSSA